MVMRPMSSVYGTDCDDYDDDDDHHEEDDEDDKADGDEDDDDDDNDNYLQCERETPPTLPSSVALVFFSKGNDGIQTITNWQDSQQQSQASSIPKHNRPKSPAL